MDRRPDIVAAAERMTSPDEVRREIQHLPEYLRAGESVQRLAAGVYGVGTGLLAVTDSRVVVLREGRAGQASEGFPFEQLSGLDWAAMTPEHATITIRDTTRTTEFTQVAPTDAAELVGFVQALLRAQAAPPVTAPPVAVPPAAVPPAAVPPAAGAAPAAAPPVVPSRGAPAGGSIGHKFDAPPAAATPGAGAPAEPVPPGGVAGAGYDSTAEAGAPVSPVESTAGARGERWPLREVPVSQLTGTPPEATDRPAGAASTTRLTEGRTVGEPVEPPAASAAPYPAPPNDPSAPSGSDAPSRSDAPNAQSGSDAVVPEETRDPAAAKGAGVKTARRPRFWQRSRAREADRTPPAGA
jgi:hypothetical protein